MTIEIPDPATLSGEELNYWTGVAAGKEIAWSPTSYFTYEKVTWIRNGVRWNPTQDAVQCLEITPRCNIHYRDYLKKKIDGVTIKANPEWCALIDDGEGIGTTELEARCRAFLEAKRRGG